MDFKGFTQFAAPVAFSALVEYAHGDENTVPVLVVHKYISCTIAEVFACRPDDIGFVHDDKRKELTKVVAADYTSWVAENPSNRPKEELKEFFRMALGRALKKMSF